MANPTLGGNVYPSVIAVPSLTANEYAITPSSTQNIGAMKTALLAMDGHLHFDVNNTGDYVLHSATIEQLEGKEYNNGKEQLASCSIVFEPNNDEGSTGETARTAIESLRRGMYDLYFYDNQTRTNSVVAKMVGVVMDLTKPTVTPGDKTIITASGQVKQEADYTINLLTLL